MDKLGLPDFISVTVVHCRALREVVDEVPIPFALIAGLWREMYTTHGKLRASGSLCRSYKTPSRVSPSTQPANHLLKRSMVMFSCKSEGKFKMMFQPLTCFEFQNSGNKLHLHKNQ
jgi:hypothetical protein